jgi:hypothetical protein
MTSKNYLLTGTVLSMLASASVGLSQTINASDNAGNYSSWTSGSTGGTGFGTWSFNDATPNGGFSGQFLSTGGSTSIDTAGNAFGMYANGGASAEAQASRSFSAGSLTANQSFSIQMQNGNVTDNGGQVGFNLQDSSADNLFQFYFAGGGADYDINVGGNQISTGVGYTSGPLTLSFSQGVGNAWSFSIFEGATLAATLSSGSTGDLLSANDISQVNLYTLNGGTARTLGDNGNVYYNNLQIETQAAPEPSVALLGMSGLATLYLVRRRH